MKDLQKQLEEQRKALGELEKARGEVAQEQGALQQDAQKSLAGIAVDKLMGRARSQAEKAVEATALGSTVAELDNRIAALRADIAKTQEAIDRAQADELKVEAAAIKAELADLSPELEAKAQRLRTIRTEVIELLSPHGVQEKAAALSFAGGLSSVIADLRQAAGTFRNGNH